MGPLTWIGLVVAVAALALLAWSLAGDRSRGRRRCPKCWHELGAGEHRRCPECGHEARSERRLGRTRRRWGRAVLAIVGLVVAGGLAWGQHARNAGPARATPTSVLVVIWPHVPIGPWWTELQSRLGEGELSRRQTGRVIDDALAIIEAKESPVRIAGCFELLERIQAASRRVRADRPWSSSPSVTELRPNAPTSLAALAAHPGLTTGLELTDWIRMFGRDARVALPAIVVVLAGEDRVRARGVHDSIFVFRDQRGSRPIPPAGSWPAIGVRFNASTHPQVVINDRGRSSDAGEPLLPLAPAFVDALRSAGPNHDGAVEAFRSALRRSDPLGRVVSLWALEVLEAPPGPEDLAAVAALLEHPSSWVRYHAIIRTGRLPWSDDVEAVLSRALADPNAGVRCGGMLMIERRGAEARALAADVRASVDHGTRRVEHSSFSWRDLVDEVLLIGPASVALHRLGEDPAELQARLARILDARLTDTDDRLDLGVHFPPILGALAEIQSPSPEAVAVLEAVLAEDTRSAGRADIRAQVAEALASSGGDRARATRVLLRAARPEDSGMRFRGYHLQEVSRRMGRRGHLDGGTILEALASDDVRDLHAANFVLSRSGIDLAPFAGRLRILGDDPDPARSDAVSYALHLLHRQEAEAKRASDGATAGPR